MGTAVAIAVLVGVGAVASPAAAAEQVADGGFEQTTCPTDGFSCTNPSWTEGGTQSFVCKTPGCTTNTENFPRTASGWLQLGGDTTATGGETGTLTMTQPLLIPRAPASLSYWVRRYGSANNGVFSNFTVRIDGQLVADSFLQDPPGGAPEALPYQKFTVDLSAFAGPAARTLSLQTSCSYFLGGTAPCDVFLIDDVSLTVPDPPVTNTPSKKPSRKCGKKRKGKRAAAAKCKKRKKKKKKS